MTQSVVVQVGQCGNQVGCRFWDLALREHSHVNKSGRYDQALSSFFRNVDSSSSRTAAGEGTVQSLKARAVLLDMEEGVVAQLLQGPLREVFDSGQLLTGVSGSGNNWAVGHLTYGSVYREQLVNRLRRAAEQCDCLQTFFILHSMGGGTGSGLGTRVLGLLEEEFPEVSRMVAAIFPWAQDDVVTSPYNSLLALSQLAQHASCVLPVDNQSLLDIVSRVQLAAGGARPGPAVRSDGGTLSSGRGGVARAERPFDAMNSIVANLLLNLTSGARFEGSLNTDLNEIAVNLVPFPRLHFLVPSLTPLYTLADVAAPTRSLEQMFSEAFSADHQLLQAQPRRSLYLACGLLVRGRVALSDLRRNIHRLRPGLSFVPWNQEGWKTGLCSVPPVGQAQSLLTLANNTCVKFSFMRLRERFCRLYRRKAHLHHYLQVEGMEQSAFAEAAASLDSLIQEYDGLDAMATAHAPRLQIAP